MRQDIKQLVSIFLGLFLLQTLSAQEVSRVEINLGKRGAKIPSSLYGVFFEEISGSGDGGLYAELVRNS